MCSELMSHLWGTLTFTVVTANIYTPIHITVLSPFCCKNNNLYPPVGKNKGKVPQKPALGQPPHFY